MAHCESIDQRLLFSWDQWIILVGEVRLIELYVKGIVRGNSVMLTIAINRDKHFTHCFWQGLHKELGTRLILMLTAYHKQTNDQNEHTIQTLEDMSWSCTIDFSGLHTNPTPGMPNQAQLQPSTSRSWIVHPLKYSNCKSL